jgi:hypothetical protein
VTVFEAKMEGVQFTDETERRNRDRPVADGWQAAKHTCRQLDQLVVDVQLAEPSTQAGRSLASWDVKD